MIGVTLFRKNKAKVLVQMFGACKSKDSQAYLYHRSDHLTLVCSRTRRGVPVAMVERSVDLKGSDSDLKLRTIP